MFIVDYNILLKTLEKKAKSCDSYIAKSCGLCRWPLDKNPTMQRSDSL